MTKDRPAYMLLGCVVCAIGMMIFAVGYILPQSPIGVFGLLAGSLLMLTGTIWIFWGGD